MRGMRLPVTTALLGVTLAAGCTSSSGASPPSSPAATSPPSTSTSPSQSAVASPVAASPTPVDRTLTRPPGASLVDKRTCDDETLQVVDLYLANQIFAAPDAAAQRSQLPGAARLADEQRGKVQRARRTWLRDGYPASFPMVRDLGGYISVYTKIITAARANQLDPLPRLYLELEKVDTQYGADLDNSNVCIGT